MLSQIQLKVVDTVRPCGFHAFPVVRAGGCHQHTVWLRRSTQSGLYPDLYLQSSSYSICSAFSVVIPFRTRVFEDSLLLPYSPDKPEQTDPVFPAQ